MEKKKRRPKGSKDRIAVSLSRELYEEMSRFCLRTGVKKYHIVDTAIGMFLDAEKKKMKTGLIRQKNLKGGKDDTKLET